MRLDFVGFQPLNNDFRKVKFDPQPVATSVFTDSESGPATAERIKHQVTGNRR